MVRQMKSGGKFYYQFIKNGKRFNGVCHGCTTRREAEAFEKNLKATTDEAAKKRTVKSLIESFRDELNGGYSIKLDEAFDLSLKKPRKKQTSEKFQNTKREAFRDFVQFMKDKYPETTELSDVTHAQAEEYISMVRQSGRYMKVIVYVRDGKKICRPVSASSPSSRTANLYQDVCAEVFRLLYRDAGLIDNPFDMPKLKSDEETREAFSDAELQLIFKEADDFTRPLFAVAIATALREGDICTLKWTDIDFRERVIRRVMNKTGNTVEIPLVEQTFLFFSQQHEKTGDCDYVFPEHAAMYLKNPTGVSYRVKQFLERIGIQTTRTPKGRSRAVSVKDLHSCRHTFCYFAGLNGIPLNIVQSIVGHMTPEMTKHYSAHATLADKRERMLNMQNIIDVAQIQQAIPCLPEEPERAELQRLADSLPLEKVREILNHYRQA